MSDDKHHQRVVLDTIRRRIDSLTEIQGLLDSAAAALGRAAMLSESGCRPSTPEPLKSALVELNRLSEAARLECLQTTHKQQRSYADQVLVVAGSAPADDAVTFEFPLSEGAPLPPHVAHAAEVISKLKF